MSGIYAGGSYRSYVSINVTKKDALCCIELKIISQVSSDAYQMEQGYISAKVAY